MEQQDNSMNYSNNKDFINQNALKVRLDVSEVLIDIESFLRGYKTDYTQDNQGNITPIKIKTGEAKCNNEGVQSILSFLRMIINTQVVQGNFVTDSGNDSSMYYNYVSNCRSDLTDAMILNIYKWGININEAEFIADSIMNIVIPFMTRLIDNKERESYANTIKHEERNTLTKDDNKFKIFG